MDKTFNVSLSYDELMLLDGKVSDLAQKEIDKVKKEKSWNLDDFSTKVISKALENGKLFWLDTKISGCSECRNKPYRLGPYKFFKRKKDIDKLKYQGVCLFTDNRTVDYTFMEICKDCWYNIYLPKIIRCIINNDLPIQIQQNSIIETKYKKDKLFVCFNGVEIYESEIKDKNVCIDCEKPYTHCRHCNSIEKYTDTEKFRMIKL